MAEGKADGRVTARVSTEGVTIVDETVSDSLNTAFVVWAEGSSVAGKAPPTVVIAFGTVGASGRIERATDDDAGTLDVTLVGVVEGLIGLPGVHMTSFPSLTVQPAAIVSSDSSDRMFFVWLRRWRGDPLGIAANNVLLVLLCRGSATAS